MSKLNQTKYFI